MKVIYLFIALEAKNLIQKESRCTKLNTIDSCRSKPCQPSEGYGLIKVQAFRQEKFKKVELRTRITNKRTIGSWYTPSISLNIHLAASNHIKIFTKSLNQSFFNELKCSWCLCECAC